MKKNWPFFQRLGLGAAVGLIATIAYQSTQFLSADRAVIRDECWSWHWLPFHADWIWPYLSMFLLVGLPWFFLPDYRQVRRFALCLLALAAAGWITFLVYPTACARPAPDGQPGYYAMLLLVDQSNNCCPCLHSALSVLAAWALAQGNAFFGRPIAKALLIVWLVTICVAIVALRQHTDIDTLIGVALGCIGAWAWSRSSASRHAAWLATNPERPSISDIT